MKGISLLIASAAIIGFAGVAQADPGVEPNENAANGQEKKGENCFAVVQKQDAAGQTGDATGSANSSKNVTWLTGVAVTNCDGFYQDLGIIGPD